MGGQIHWPEKRERETDRRRHRDRCIERGGERKRVRGLG